MSNFITNLARRSAGLAPVVAARVSPVAGVGEGGAAAEPKTAPRVPAQPISRAAESQPGAAPIHIYVEAATPATPAAVSIVPAPVQPLAAKPVAPAEPQIRETTRISTTTILVPATPAPSRAQTDAPASLPPVRDAPDTAQPPRIEPRIAEPEVDVALPVPESGRHEEPMVPDAISPRPRGESLREIIHHIEHKVEPAAALSAPAPAVSIQPALAREPEIRAPEVHAAENRIVQVRIGAIEIHAAAPQAAAPAPSAPAAAQRAAPVGFDGFARLRSYAPWEW